MNMTEKTRKLTTVGMLCALAYVVMVVGRIPVVMFLKFDPKDVIIAIGGFIYGPFTAFLISLVVGFIEMCTVSETGIIGFIMNVLGSVAFASTAAYSVPQEIYEEALRKSLHAKCKGRVPEDKAERDKLTASLVRLGFSPSVIFSAMNELSWDE